VLLLALIPFIPLILRHWFNAIDERDRRKKEREENE
jgi:hypothetical protein